MKKENSLIKLLFFNISLLLFISSQLLASNDENEVFFREHSPIKSRTMAEEKQTRLSSQRQQEVIEAEETFKKEKRNSVSAQKHPFKPTQSTAFVMPDLPLHFHWLIGFSSMGDCLQFEDESHWKISPKDSHKVFFWRPGDILILTPNSGFLFVDKNYDFCITNQTRGSSVEATLFLGPIQFGLYSHFIVGMDYYLGHVFLENGTSWCIYPEDSYLFEDWAVEDTIIFGINDSWLTSFKTILYNVNINNYVRAKQF